ncbi:hypothetical protein D3C86_1024290 [compost metagenome]
MSSRVKKWLYASKVTTPWKRTRLKPAGLWTRSTPATIPASARAVSEIPPSSAGVRKKVRARPATTVMMMGRIESQWISMFIMP